MNSKGIHTILKGMNLCELKRDSCDLKGIQMILERISLYIYIYEFKGDPSIISIPTKPARQQILIPGDQTLYIIRHSGSCWTTTFEI